MGRAVTNPAEAEDAIAHAHWVESQFRWGVLTLAVLGVVGIITQQRAGAFPWLGTLSLVVMVLCVVPIGLARRAVRRNKALAGKSPDGCT